MSFITNEYEMAWTDLPDLPKWSYEGQMNPPYDKVKLAKIQEIFINNGRILLELEEIYFYVLFDYVNDLIIA